MKNTAKTVNRWTGINFRARVEEITATGIELEAAKLQARTEERAAMRTAFDAMQAESTLIRFSGMKNRVAVSLSGEVSVRARATATYARNAAVTNAEEAKAIAGEINRLVAIAPNDAEHAARIRSRACKLRSKLKELAAPRVNGVRAVVNTKPVQTPESIAKLAAKRARQSAVAA